MQALFLLDADACNAIYSPAERADIERLVCVYAPPQTAETVKRHPEVLTEAEIILGGMITGAHLASMAPNTTFINTSRGAIVREQEMIEVLRQRPDLYAILDVTYPEPPKPDSPLSNVVLTPHIAGSKGNECQRMGRMVVEELQRYVHGEPLQRAISKEQAAIMA